MHVAFVTKYVLLTKHDKVLANKWGAKAVLYRYRNHKRMPYQLKDNSRIFSLLL